MGTTTANNNTNTIDGIIVKRRKKPATSTEYSGCETCSCKQNSGNNKKNKDDDDDETKKKMWRNGLSLSSSILFSRSQRESSKLISKKGKGKNKRNNNIVLVLLFTLALTFILSCSYTWILHNRMMIVPGISNRGNQVPPLTSFIPHHLNELSHKEQSSMNWLEKGNWLVQNNLPYISKKAREPNPIKSITLVTVLLDIGRGNLKQTGRTFVEYIQRSKQFMDYDFPKIIFLDHRHVDRFEFLKRNSPGPCHIIPISKADIRQEYFARHFDKLQSIRTNTTWLNRASWLSQSPQALLDYYNPLVMSKVKFMLKAAQLNPFQTDGFLFLDAGHLCHNPQQIQQEQAEPWIIRQFFPPNQDRLLMTFFSYEPNGEIHGFEEDAFRKYIGKEKGGKGKQEQQQQQHVDTSPMKNVYVGRGGVFGGRPEFIALANELMELLIAETLGAGVVGTEENLFSILYYRWPELIRYFSNDDTGGNCAIFSKFIPPKMMNLRGLECAVQDPTRGGGFVCFNKDDGQYCPEQINPTYLTEAVLSHPEECASSKNKKKKDEDASFCTARCTSKGDILWTRHSKSDCATNKNSSCPEEPKGIFENELPAHVVTKRPDPTCRLAAGGKWSKYPELFWNSTALSLLNHYNDEDDGDNNESEDGKLPFVVPKDTPLSRISIIMLVMNTDSELQAIKDSLKTHKAHGLLGAVGEIIVWVNGRKYVTNQDFEEYISEYGLKLLGTTGNAGQTWAINSLFEAVSKDYVLFLEKDFRLVEPWPCVLEQLSAGVAMIESGQAQFVKYRHRWRPGNPLTALSLFRGQEETVFTSQPNLLCYHYHWLDNPENQWGDKFNFCNQKDKDGGSSEPYMYCFDAEYCGFTLNPFLVSKSFWTKEYDATKFNEWKVHDPFNNLEYFMNWEPDAWNTRGWTVAQGEGLFRHEDFGKYGI